MLHTMALSLPRSFMSGDVKEVGTHRLCMRIPADCEYILVHSNFGFPAHNLIHQTSQSFSMSHLHSQVEISESQRISTINSEQADKPSVPFCKLKAPLTKHERQPDAAAIYSMREPHLPGFVTPSTYASGPRQDSGAYLQGDNYYDDYDSWELYGYEEFVEELTVRLNHVIVKRDWLRKAYRDARKRMREAQEMLQLHDQVEDIWIYEAMRPGREQDLRDAESDLVSLRRKAWDLKVSVRRAE